MTLSASKGQRFHCQNPHCDCEIQITRVPAVNLANPRCLCGSEMKRINMAPAITTRPAPVPLDGEASPAKTVLSASD